jgi:hypothetical protein
LATTTSPTLGVPNPQRVPGHAKAASALLHHISREALISVDGACWSCCTPRGTSGIRQSIEAVGIMGQSHALRVIRSGLDPPSDDTIRLGELSVEVV